MLCKIKKKKRKNLPKSISVPMVISSLIFFSFVGLRQVAKDQIQSWGLGTPTHIGFFPESISPISYSFRLDPQTIGEIRFDIFSSVVYLEASTNAEMEIDG